MVREYEWVVRPKTGFWAALARFFFGWNMSETVLEERNREVEYDVDVPFEQEVEFEEDVTDTTCVLEQHEFEIKRTGKRFLGWGVKAQWSDPKWDTEEEKDLGEIPNRELQETGEETKGIEDQRPDTDEKGPPARLASVTAIMARDEGH
jgi:hypothetical protein